MDADKEYHLNEEEIDKLTVQSLKSYLRRHDQQVTGNKQALRERAKGVRKLNLRCVLDVEAEENFVLQRRWTEKLTTPLGESIPDPGSLKCWTKDISDIPDVTDKDIYNYIVLTMKSKRQLRSRIYYNDGHVHDINFNAVSPECSHGIVKAKVIPSLPTSNQKKNPDHDVWICLAKATGNIHSANCDCTAGEGEACNHIGALLYALEDISIKKKDGTAACTSGENQWLKPRKRKLSPLKAQNIIFKSSSHLKDKFSNENIDNANINVNSIESCRKKLKNTTVNEDRFKRRLEMNHSKAGWLLFFGKKPEETLPVLHEQQFSFSDKVNLNSSEAKTFFKDCFEKMSLTEKECVSIEKLTKGQTSNIHWQDARSQRLTSSNFGPVYCRKDDTKPDKLVKALMYADFDNLHLKWGRDHEPAARRVYGNSMVKKHAQFCLSLCGLIVNTDYPHLGSSPDGLTSCQCCGEGLLEIKCPSSNKYKFTSPTDCCKDKNFYCVLDENNNISLKKNHKYYYQVQGQMGITKRQYCDFVVWTLKGFGVERIEFDLDLWNKMVQKLNKFYLEAMLPELFTSRVKRDLPLY